jgi:NAD-dependent dihydropyrimidine dehydrogenase PreA subunit
MLLLGAMNASYGNTSEFPTRGRSGRAGRFTRVSQTKPKSPGIVRNKNTSRSKIEPNYRSPIAPVGFRTRLCSKKSIEDLIVWNYNNSGWGSTNYRWVYPGSGRYKVSTNAKPDRGSVEMNSEECKGCGLCIEACPPKVLRLAGQMNRYGYHPAIYLGSGCTGCGICYYVCPEPGGIRVLRWAAAPAAELAGAV